MAIERAFNNPEQANVIKLRMSALKAELIGLTQQYDKIMGNPVADRMIVTVDTVPSPLQPEPIRGGSDEALGEYDPRTVRLARRAYNLSRDIR